MKLEIIEGNIEEEVFRTMDNYLFDAQGAERVEFLKAHLSLVEGHDLNDVNSWVTSGIRRAVESYFPLRRFSN